jgi:hypothetical protein
MNSKNLIYDSQNYNNLIYKYNNQIRHEKNLEQIRHRKNQFSNNHDYERYSSPSKLNHGTDSSTINPYIRYIITP